MLNERQKLKYAEYVNETITTGSITDLLSMNDWLAKKQAEDKTLKPFTVIRFSEQVKAHLHFTIQATHQVFANRKADEMLKEYDAKIVKQLAVGVKDMSPEARKEQLIRKVQKMQTAEQKQADKLAARRAELIKLLSA